MKKSFALVLALAMSLTGASALAAEKVTVRFGNTAGEDDIQSISLRDVAGRLAEATDGNFDAQVYLSSSLGDTDDLTEQAMQGAPIVTVSDPSRLQSFVKDYGILGMPYMFDSYEGLDTIMATDTYAKWAQEFADQGIWLVTSNWFSGVRNFTCDKVVKEPADLIGSVVSGTTFRDSLSDDYQKLFADTFYAVGSEYQSKCAELSKQYEEEMVAQHGLTINEDVDVDAFKAATAPVYDELGYADIRAQIYAEMGL